MAFFNVEFKSEILGFNTKTCVILPQNHKKAKLKTLYLLHGMGGTESNWSRLTTVESFANKYQLAVVMPFANDSWYTNMKFGWKYYDFIARELPKTCREFFPQLSIDAKDNILLGNSMGGYGALKIGLRESNAFGYIGCFSGAFDVETFARERYEGNEGYWTAIFGDLGAIRNSEDDVFYLAEKYSKTSSDYHIYMWCGEQDYLFQHSEKMSKLLKSLNYDVTYKYSAGSHEWQSWQNKIQDFFEWLISKKILN